MDNDAEGNPQFDFRYHDSHNQMADSYRSLIEAGLREFDDSKSDSFYQAMAWGGLIGTDAWGELKPEVQQDNEAVIDSEAEGGTGCD